LQCTFVKFVNEDGTKNQNAIIEIPVSADNVIKGDMVAEIHSMVTSFKNKKFIEFSYPREMDFIKEGICWLNNSLINEGQDYQCKMEEPMIYYAGAYFLGKTLKDTILNNEYVSVAQSLVWE